MGCLVNPLEGYGPATGDYATIAVVKGFIEGYQTMDTIAALAFGIVIAVNIHARGRRRGRRGAGHHPGRVGRRRCCWRSTPCWPTSAPCLGRTPQPDRRGGEALTMWWACCSAPWAASCWRDLPHACFNCAWAYHAPAEYFHSICPRLSYRGGRCSSLW